MIKGESSSKRKFMKSKKVMKNNSDLLRRKSKGKWTTKRRS